MKKLSLLLALVCALLSCKAPQFYIGMEEREFLKHNRVQVVQTSAEGSIYRKTNYPFGGAPITKFFYFRHGVLAEVNEGEQAPNIIVEHR